MNVSPLIVVSGILTLAGMMCGGLYTTFVRREMNNTLGTKTLMNSPLNTGLFVASVVVLVVHLGVSADQTDALLVLLCASGFVNVGWLAHIISDIRRIEEAYRFKKAKTVTGGVAGHEYLVMRRTAGDLTELTKLDIVTILNKGETLRFMIPLDVKKRYGIPLLREKITMYYGDGSPHPVSVGFERFRD